MENDNHHSKTTAIELIFEYEAMSHEGTVGFLEKKDFLKIVEYYRSDKQLGKAIEVTRQAISQYHYSSDIHILHAELLLEEGQAKLALKALNQAEILSPSELEIQLLRAEAWAALGKSKTAYLILESAEENADELQKSDIYFCKACIHEHFKEFNKMFDSLRDAMLANAGNAPALERLWLGVELSRRYEDSIKLHHHLIENNPYCFISWYNLGHAYSSIGQHENAAKAFEYAYLIDESFEFAYRDCAESWIRIHAFEKAIHCYEEAMEHFDPDSDLYIKLGYCCEQLTDFARAKSFYIKALRLDDHSGEAYYRLGRCFTKEKRWQSAIGAFAKAILLDDRKEEYLYAMGKAYFETSEKQKSLEWFQKAVDTAPDQSKYWIQHAHCLMQLGNTEEAMSVLEEARDYVSSSQLLFCEAACLFESDRRKEGLFLFSKALAEDYNQHFILFNWLPGLKKDTDIRLILNSHRLDKGGFRSSPQSS